jgi:imidazolonepropionase-like amidohydrolase
MLAASLSAGAQQKAVTPQLKTFTVIRAGNLIDGKSDAPRRDQVIVIRGNLIDSVADAATATIPPGSTVIDLSKATVLPGLIDSHTHIFLQGEDPAEGGYDVNILKYPASLRAARATVAVRRALEQGFTALRDVETEGAGYGDVGIKEAIEGGYIPGPRLFVATRAISTTGGYPLEGYAPELTMPKGAQGRPRATGQWRRLDQGLHDAPLLGGQERRTGCTAHAHSRGTEGYRRRNPWLGQKSRLPRLHRHRPAARARRRLRLH